MIRKENGIVVLSAVIGLAIWVIDAAMDATFFLEGSFLNLVILDVPGQKLHSRVLLLTSFVAFGVVVSLLMSRQEHLRGLIEQAKKEWEETFDIINDAITVHDSEFNIVRANRAASHMLGAPFDVILGRKCHLSYHGSDYPPDTCPSCRTLATGVPSISEIFEENLNRHLEIKALPRIGRDNRVIGVVHVVRDISERVKAEEQLRSLSLTDDLTGLFNRRGFITLAEQQQKVSFRMQKGFYILFADMDGLKDINDAFGHQEGCTALIETAGMLRACFRESDIIGRIGGDEFVVFIMENAESRADVISERLQARIDEYNARSNCRYRLSVSTGVAYCGPESHRSLTDVMHEADQLMYAQKMYRKGLHGKG